MKLFMIICMFFPISCFSLSLNLSGSQKRFPDETYEQAKTRVVKALPHMFVSHDDSAEANRLPISKIDYSHVPIVQTPEQLIHIFQIIRDTRFLKTFRTPDFLRRITWFYPDDGCPVRASLGGMKAEEETLVRPAKIFAFGSLNLKTPYSPDGEVYWWFHVALVLGYNNEYFVIDPAIDQYKPMPVNQWFESFSKNTDVTGVVCNKYTYGAFDDCFNASEKSDTRAHMDTYGYLVEEWDRVAYLGFDPYELLGESPPWLTLPQDSVVVNAA